MSIQQHQVADDLSPDTAARARITTQRADRLREFILGHVPEDVTVDVVISSGVQTAAVLPTDVEAIVSSDATDIERVQAKQFLAGVDADYLVLVTGNEAELTRIPLNDQLTADHAHQFGLAFHELLHILKTAIVTIGQLIEEEVDEQYHEQVHDLINIIEDGAIESEAIHGNNFSNNAGIRLELTRRIHSQTPEDIPDGEEVHYSFWDAVTSCLYDKAIYPTGTTEVLLDEDDSRVQFKSDADRTAFEQIHSELCNLSRDALAIRSADRSDTTHSHDKTASIRRARRVIETWKTHIQPVLEADTNEEEEEEEEAKEAQGQGQANQQDGEGESQPQPQSSDGEEDQSDEATGQPGPASHPDGDGDTSSRNEGLQDGTQDASPDAGPVDELPEDFDPSEVSLSREATDDSRQNVFEQPQITADPGLDEVDDTDSEDPRDFHDSEDSNDSDNDEDIDDTERNEKTASEEEDESSSNSETDGTQELGDENQSESGADSQSESKSEAEAEAESKPSNRAEAIAQAADRVREREHEQHQSQNRDTETDDPETSVPSPGSGSDDTETEDPPQSAASRSINNDRRDGQTQNHTLGDFSDSTDGKSESDGDETSESGDSESEDEHSERGEHSEQNNESESGNEKDETGTRELDAENAAESDETNQLGPKPESESESESEIPEIPAHAESVTRSPEEEEAAYEDGLTSDERAAHDEADREGIDQKALDDELSALADQLDRSDSGQAQSDQDNENSDQSGGSRGGPGSLDELNILPISEDIAPPREWAAIEDGAGQVAATLEMYLRLDRRKSVRRGLSAGAYDTRAGHRLAIGNPRVCKSRTLGNEKQYALVLILDRSSSMRRGSPPKIEIAAQALARFALAAENLGIRVAIIDFIDGEARLVKPFSVETRHVQTTLLDESCGGGTPLSDAIGLARELIEAQRDEPLVITVTDDKPSSIDDVIDQIRRSHAPVCSLTVATDCEPGTLSDSASELARYYERQEAVYTPDRLDDRLDQFASLLGGL